MQIARAFGRGQRYQVDEALADLIFMEGLPMRLVKSPYMGRLLQVQMSYLLSLRHALLVCVRHCRELHTPAAWGDAATAATHPSSHHAYGT